MTGMHHCPEEEVVRALPKCQANGFHAQCSMPLRPAQAIYIIRKKRSQIVSELHRSMANHEEEEDRRLSVERRQASAHTQPSQRHQSLHDKHAPFHSKAGDMRLSLHHPIMKEQRGIVHNSPFWPSSSKCH